MNIFFATTERIANHDVLKVQPESTAYATRNSDTPMKALELFFNRLPSHVTETIIRMTLLT